MSISHITESIEPEQHEPIMPLVRFDEEMCVVVDELKDELKNLKRRIEELEKEVKKDGT